MEESEEYLSIKMNIANEEKLLANTESTTQQLVDEEQVSKKNMERLQLDIKNRQEELDSLYSSSRFSSQFFTPFHLIYPAPRRHMKMHQRADIWCPRPGAGPKES